MTGRRKSCKTNCKKAAASSLPIVEVGVPGVDGFLYQNTDDEENRSPGFRSRTADASPDPATAGTADAALTRTEPTPGFRKTASRKGATLASSFTAVAQQKDKVKDNSEAEDNGMINTKDSPCSDKKEAKDAEGCSDQRASKAEVAVHVETKPKLAISDTAWDTIFKKFTIGEKVLKGFEKDERENLKKLIELIWDKYDLLGVYGKEPGTQIIVKGSISKYIGLFLDYDDIQKVTGDQIRGVMAEYFELEKKKDEEFVEELCRIFLAVKLHLCLQKQFDSAHVKVLELRHCYETTDALVSRGQGEVTFHVLGRNDEWSVPVDGDREYDANHVAEYLAGIRGDAPKAIN